MFQFNPNVEQKTLAPSPGSLCPYALLPDRLMNLIIIVMVVVVMAIATLLTNIIPPAAQMHAGHCLNKMAMSSVAIPVFFRYNLLSSKPSSQLYPCS